MDTEEKHSGSNIYSVSRDPDDSYVQLCTTFCAITQWSVCWSKLTCSQSALLSLHKSFVDSDERHSLCRIGNNACILMRSNAKQR